MIIHNINQNIYYDDIQGYNINKSFSAHVIIQVCALSHQHSAIHMDLPIIVMETGSLVQWSSVILIGGGMHTLLAGILAEVAITEASELHVIRKQQF